jgi:hypothetical protein
MPSFLSSNNCTFTPLLANATFTGKSEQVLNYTCADLVCETDQNSAIVIYASNDGTHWNSYQTFNVVASTPFTNIFLLEYRYLYATITNSTGVNQTYLRFQLIFREHSHFLQFSSSSTLTANQGTGNSLANGWPVEITDGTNVLGTVAHPVNTNVQNFPATQACTQSGTWNVNNVSGTVSLPTGCSTSALQSTGNGYLSTLATNVPAQGQATMTASLPVAIASNQSTLNTSVQATGVYSHALNQDVSGNLGVNVQNFPATQACTQSGTWNVNNVSGTISLPTGCSTSALQTTANSSLSSIATNTNSLNGLTNTSNALDINLKTLSLSSIPITNNSYTYKHINSNTSAIVKSGAGVLYSVAINTKGASSNTITLYDGLSSAGTVIATIDTTANTQSILYNVAYSTGLFFQTQTGTAGDFTIAYT